MRLNKKILQKSIKEITIIIPIYNEILAIKKNARSIIETFKKINNNYEVLFIESGSNDGSYNELKTIKKNNKKVRILREKKRNGYGSAIKHGFQNSKFSKICTFPIDNQYSAKQLVDILNRVKDDNVVTFREDKKVVGYRYLQSYIYKFFTKSILKLNFIDVNSLKILNKTDFPIFNSFSNNWTIDLEILYYMKVNNISYKEIGIKLNKRNIGKSKVRVFDVLFMFIGILKIKKSRIFN